MNNDLIQLIMTRTSIRAFQDKPSPTKRSKCS